MLRQVDMLAGEMGIVLCVELWFLAFTEIIYTAIYKDIITYPLVCFFEHMYRVVEN